MSSDGSALRIVPIVAAGAAAGLVAGFALAQVLQRSQREQRLREQQESYGKTVSDLEREFSISPDQLHKITYHFLSELQRGLASHDATIKMLPSHVTKLPSGSLTGTFYALDLGGTNFRVCETHFEGQGGVRLRQKKFVISEALKTGPGELLFDFIASCVQEFLRDIGVDASSTSGTPLKMGFTFSFPVQQTALNRGKLIHWNKGFTAPGVEGEDVVELLQQSLRKRGVFMDVAAIVNDTVGTLVAHAYKENQTYVGVILGTGTNAAYVEDLDEVKKLSVDEYPRDGKEIKSRMIINTEWGAFDNEHRVLPVTPYDRKLDEESANPGSQCFEKMISGMYLGEISRQVLVELIKKGKIFDGRSSVTIERKGTFETAFMSRIERDHSRDLSDTKIVLEDLLGIAVTTLDDRQIVKRTCELVAIRAARLAAAGVAALVSKINSLNGCTVAIDGSVFEHYPHFSNRMRDALRELLGLFSDNIHLSLERDGSSVGAGLIAALA